MGLSNFAGAVGIGLSGVDARTRLRVGIAFGLFEAGMPLLGLLIGRQLAGGLGNAGRYIGAGLLILTGIYTIFHARQMAKGEERAQGELNRRRLLVMALALSLDNLVVGFALGVFRLPIAVAAVVMGAVSVLMSLVGLELGSRLGARVEEWAEEIGGAVLILVGLGLATGLI